MKRDIEFSGIWAIVFDVDGVFTDGRLLVTEEGHLLRTMSTRDGYAIKRALAAGIKIAVITGGNSEGVRKRLSGLGIEEVYLGVADKLPVLRSLSEAWGIRREAIAYVGDDMPDYACMKWSGMAICPADAVSEIQILSHYITAAKGGKGCVREVIECILKEKGKW